MLRREGGADDSDEQERDRASNIQLNLFRTENRNKYKMTPPNKTQIKPPVGRMMCRRTTQQQQTLDLRSEGLPCTYSHTCS